MWGLCSTSGLVIKILNLSPGLEGKDSVILLGSLTDSRDLHSRIQTVIGTLAMMVIKTVLSPHSFLPIRPN